MSAYDLILQGGTLYNPCAGTMELCDLAIKDGKIAARGKNLNAADAETVMDVTGLIVSPGLIDMHCHVYPVFPYQMPDSLRTINAEEYMFRAGVTTAVDAGTTGWRNFGDFKENVIDATKVRVLAFIDMAAKGMHYPPSEQAVADINPEITAAVAKDNIRVNTICPGVVISDVMYDDMDKLDDAGKKQLDAALHRCQPLEPGRMQDIANTALFFASNMSANITGQTLLSDGGTSIKAHDMDC